MAEATIPRLARPRLTVRIAESLDEGHVLLLAGAGFGKTVALEDALDERDSAVAWVRCGASRGDPGRLLELTVEALRAVQPGVVDAFGERIGGGVDPIDVSLAGRSIATELARLLTDPLTLAFDDAEILAGRRPAVDLLDQLLASRAPALAVAIGSRERLPLRARSRLTHLGPGDLAFTPEECAELFAAAGDEERADEVWAATEGWPIAVALATVAPAEERTAGSSESLRAYLDRVLAALPPDLLEAILTSSLPDDLEPSLLRALDLPETLGADASRRGLPVQTLRDGGGRWTYHPLVREVLQERLREDRATSALHDLHRRSARSLEEAGRGPEAVEHWLSADAPDEAARAVVEWGAQLARTAPAMVKGWLERLPGEARAAPALRLLEGRLAAGTGRLEEALVPLTAAVEGFAREGDEHAEWLARSVLTDTRAILERFDEAIPLADGWAETPAGAAPLVAITVAAALAGAARYRDSSELFEQSLEHPVGQMLEPLVRGFHGFWVDLNCGRLDAALTGLRRAAAALEREDPFDRLPYVLGMLAVVREERGEDDEALASFERAFRVASESMLAGYIGDIWHRFAAGTHARAGRLAAAEAELAAADGTGVGWYKGDAELTRATIAARRAEHTDALDQAEEAIAVGGLEPWRSRWRNTARLVPVLAAAGRPDRAAGLIDDAVAARPSGASCARLIALRAWLRSREGDDEGADDDLGRAWEEAGAETAHLVRRERPRLAPLLWTAAERGVLSPESAIEALAEAAPGGEALVDFAQHPRSEVRRRAVATLAACGHPSAAPWLDGLEADGDQQVAAAARAWRARLVREPPPLVIRVLGGFSARRGAYTLGENDWGDRRPAAQRLVRFLLAHRGTALSEDALFEAFWPDRAPSAARRSLQVTVSGARVALDLPGAETSVLRVSERTYRLELSGRGVVDADEFDEAARLALAAPDEDRLALLEAAAARWDGEPLVEDRLEDWATPWREHLIDLERQVLGALTDERDRTGDLAGAVEAAREWVALDPRDEAAQRRLMVAYSRAGRRGHALRQYLLCRRALLGELGIEPGAETAEVQRRILAGDPL